MNTIVHRTLGWSTAGLILSIAPACATSRPPSELIEARAAYSESKKSAAAEYDPAALHQAKQALEHAEQLYKEEGVEPKVRDAAYIAMRRAERAKVQGQIVKLNKQIEETKSQASEQRAQRAQQTQQQLQDTRQQLQTAQQGRQEAEQRAQEALMQLRLTQAAAVTQEDRGTVLTVPGAFLFASNRSELLPSANEKLNEIASALKQQDQGSSILIEGHTDSQGSAEYNMSLSKARADAVAQYLASQGVSQDKMTTSGVGETRPVASNESPEGRAMNRRVEITVRNAQDSQSG